MSKKKGLLIILALVILMGAGGYAYLALKPSSAQAQTAGRSVRTAKAFTGSVTISASGMGTVTAAKEASVGFYEQGTVGEILVNVGDEVQAGDVLARQGNSQDLELAVTNALLQLQLAENALQDIYDGYDADLANARLTAVTSRIALEDAQTTRSLLNYGRCNDDLVETYYDAYVRANREYERIRDSRVPDEVKQDAADARNAAWQNYNFCMTPYTDTEIAEGQASLSVAKAAYTSAPAQYEKLQKGVDQSQVAQAEADAASARCSLSVAQDALEGAAVTAPISGTVMSIDASVGDTVNGPFITINQTRPITLTVMLDQTDLNKIAVGYEVEVVFDAFEKQTFTGHVTRVNPGLTDMGISSVLAAEVVLDEDSYNKPQTVPIGMGASVEVINQRVTDAVLVPVEALIDLGGGEYAVFVMENGRPALRGVEVGIDDGTYAAITSGLEAGDVVTTGIVETH